MIDDRGAAPRRPDVDGDQVEDVDPGLAPAPDLLEPAGDVDPGRIAHGVRGWYRMAFQLLHLTVGRGGPPDAFQPTPYELDAMVQPMAGVLVRSGPRVAAAAGAGDTLEAVGAPAVYVVAEWERVAAHKRAVDAGAEPPPDADLGGIGIATDEPARRPGRGWRPRTDYGDGA